MGKTALWILTVFALALACPEVRSDEDGWRLEKDKDGIQVYTRAVQGWSIRELRGVTRIPAPLSSLVAVIYDVRASRELIDVVSEAEIQHRESDTRYQIYSAMKLPWPISARDILNQREIKQNKSSLAVTITDVAVQDAIAPRKGFVRIVKSRHEWTFEPTTEGAVLVEMRTLSDPAGPIPASLINAMSVSTPFKTLSKLREMAQRSEYAHAKLSFIEEAVGGVPTWQ
jgi:hypothetical protein